MNDLKENNIGTEDTKITRLPLTSDYVFKRIFAREENNSMLKDFLEAILNIHINKVEVKNPELTPNMADEKLGILDLKLDIDNERVVDVEMQVSNEHNIKERSSTYLSKLAAEQLKAKQNYKELKKIITINILKYNYLERNSYHSIARMKYEDTNPIEFVDMGYKKEEEEATNTFEMHFIELPKFKQKNPDCNTKLEQWLWLIDGSKEEKVKMSAKENEEVNKTVEELNKLSKDPDEVAKYEEREWSIMRYDVEMKTNRELGEKEGEARGLKIGKEQGRKEEKTKIIKKLYSLNIPIEKISEINPIDEENGIVDIDYIKRKCSVVFDKYNVNFCYLFGSYSKGKAKPTSDVDLLISTDATGLRFYGLVEDIRTALHKKVDVLDINQLKDNFELTQEILKDGVKIYG